MCLGVNVLGCLNPREHHSDNLGLAFWRIVAGSGIVVLVLSVFNILAVSLELFSQNERRSFEAYTLSRVISFVTRN